MHKHGDGSILQYLFDDALMKINTKSESEG